MASSGVPMTPNLLSTNHCAGSCPAGTLKRDLVVVEVADVALEAVAHVLERLLAGLGDVQRADQAQLRRVHGATVLGGDVVGDLPIGAERVETERIGRGDAEHAEAVLAREPPARRRNRADDRDFRMRLGVGR